MVTFPFPLRFLLAYDAELCGQVRLCFLKTVFAHLARRARRQGLDPAASGFRSGTVNVIQRFGGALNLNIHFHALVLDGVCTIAHAIARPQFESLPPPFLVERGVRESVRERGDRHGYRRLR